MFNAIEIPPPKMTSRPAALHRVRIGLLALLVTISISACTTNQPADDQSSPADTPEPRQPADEGIVSVDPTDQQSEPGADSQLSEELATEVERLGDLLRVVAEPAQIRLVWRDENGEPFGQLETARRALESQGLRVDVILNAGIYQPGLVPAGLHVEQGRELTSINLNEGEGNFHLLPNGVFFIADNEDGDPQAAVLESQAYVSTEVTPSLAVQSGPMLTIDGQVHPQFGPNSDSRHIRNGVGVNTDGQVVFLHSVRPINLHDFATAFLDNDVPNALYLDGVISRLERVDPDRAIFPNIPLAAMLAVVG